MSFNKYFQTWQSELQLQPSDYELVKFYRAKLDEDKQLGQFLINHTKLARLKTIGRTYVVFPDRTLKPYAIVQRSKLKKYVKEAELRIARELARKISK